MSPGALSSWQVWALASAAFAALTAIFAKIGVENVNSDFATFVRTPPNQLFFCDKMLPDGSRLLIGLGGR